MSETKELTAEREALRMAIDLLRLKHPDYSGMSYQDALEYGYIGAARALDASRAREMALVEALRHARDQIRHPDQLIDEALAPYSTPSPDMPSDCHPQGE